MTNVTKARKGDHDTALYMVAVAKIASSEELSYLIDKLCKIYFVEMNEFSYKAIVSIMDTLDSVKNKYVKHLVAGYIEQLKETGKI